MITGGGCNVFDYLLESPGQITCVDINPAQNALLELKISSLKYLDFESHFRIFGTGKLEYFKEIYFDLLRPGLSSGAKEFWNKRVRYFNNFYRHGRNGRLAYSFSKMLKLYPKADKLVNQIFRAESIEEQTELYKSLEPVFFNGFMRKLAAIKGFTYFAGVPAQQANLTGNILEYLLDRFRILISNHLMKENYFWQVYLYGSYRNSTPAYLKKGNFLKLKENTGRIRIHTASIEDFMNNTETNYDVVNLLDYQDWIYDNPAKMNRLWNLIDKRTHPGSKVIFRSASDDIRIFTKFINFDFAVTNNPHESAVHDRTCTYRTIVAIQKQ
jgi:S-adenosylmethionine-diacylglycerol 3-amino-3-carboxypropyl transferase